MNRATVTILPPCRPKNASAAANRLGVRKTYRPHRCTKARPPDRPIRYPMLSPTTAAVKAMTATATMLSRPAPA